MKKQICILFVLAFAQIVSAQWMPEVRLTDNSAICNTSYTNSSRCIASSGDIIHIVWADYREGQEEIYYKQSINKGLNWGADTRLTNAVNQSYNPSIAVSGSSVHVVWLDKRNSDYQEIFYKMSTNGGVSWGADIQLTNNSSISSYSPSISVSGSVVHVVWEDYRDVNSEIYYKRSADGGTTWGADIRLTNNTNNSQVPAIAVSGSVVHVVWFKSIFNNEIFYKRSTDDGVTWGEDTRLSNAGVSGGATYPSISVSGSYVHVVWSDTRFNYRGDIYYKLSADGGLNWGVDTRLTATGRMSSQPSIVAAGSNVHVVWEEYDIGLSEIYHKRSITQGISWDPNTRLTNFPGDSKYPSISMISNSVHVIWTDKRVGSGIYYKQNPTGEPNPIDSVVPNQNKLNVSLNSNINSYFHQNMNAATLDSNNITFFGSMTGRKRGAITYNSGTKSMQIVPSAPFKYGELISTTLDSGIKLSSGSSLAPFVWSFTTLTKPSNNVYNQTSTVEGIDYARTIATADFDGDGDLDLAVNGGGASVFILKNNEHGIFEIFSYINAGSCYGFTTGDFNNDGYTDIAMNGEGIKIFQNNGLGVFTQISSIPDAGYSIGITPGDFDGDGDLDLAFTNDQSNLVSILKNNGTGIFTLSNTDSLNGFAQVIITGDFDNDGDLDLCVNTENPYTVSIIKNNGAGKFTLSDTVSINGYGWSLATGDFNMDGYLDIAFAGNSSSSLLILKNNGTGTFTKSSDITVEVRSAGITSGDFNGDGHLDLSVTNWDLNKISILKNNGSGGFTLSYSGSVGTRPWGIVSGDFDGDGVLDIAAANNESNNISILMDLKPPQLLSPENNSIGNLNFAWKKSAGATNYRIQIASDSLFGNLIINDSTLLGTDSVKYISGLTPFTWYYWRMKSKANNGTSYWSDTWKFKTLGTPAPVILYSPENNVINMPLNITFQWSKSVEQTGFGKLKIESIKLKEELLISPDAVYGYWFEYSIDSTFLSSVVIDSLLFDTTKTVSELNDYTKYYWRVKARNESGWGGFSEIRKFTTVALPHLTLFSPANNAVDQPLNITFQWYKSIEQTLLKKSTLYEINSDNKLFKSGFSALTISNYFFEYGTDSTFATVIERDSSLTDTTKTITGLSKNTRYYWHVKAKNEFGWGGFSSNWNFTTSWNIDSVSPSQNKINIPITSDIRTYYHPVMNGSSMDSNSVIFFGSMTGRKGGTISYNSGNNSMQIIPDNPFKYGELVSTTLDTGIKTGSGVPIIPFIWSFTTMAKPSNLIFNWTSNIALSGNPFGITAGDFDSDGDLDISVTSRNTNTVSILKNNGYGSYSVSFSVGVETSPFGIATADLDNDGDLDLAVANNGSNTVSILKNDGTSIFSVSSLVSVETYPWGITTGDFDGDGDLDLAVTNSVSNSVSILMNDGNCSFSVSSTISVGSIPYGLNVGDFDNDGDLDIAVCNHNSNTVSILMNGGTGAFALQHTIGVDGGPYAVSIGDIDGDADVDFAVSNFTSNPPSVSILKNNGAGEFTLSSTVSMGNGPTGIIMADLDGDNDLDLAVQNYWVNSVFIVKNNGTGTFTNDRSFSSGYRPQTMATGDFDNNGVLDLAVANNGGNNVSILMNLTPPVLISPANNSTGNLNFAWKKSVGATNYRIQIATDSLFSNPVINDSALAGTDSVIFISELTPFTSYYWRMNSKSGSSYSLWSDTWKFKTIGSPTQVTLSSPANNALEQPRHIIFQWYKSVEQTFAKDLGFKDQKLGAKEKTKNKNDSPDVISKYWFEYGTDSTFLTVIARDSSLTDTTKTISGLSIITRYFWRVKAKNESGWGEFSSIWNFTTLDEEDIKWTKMSSGIGENLSIIALASGNSNYLFSAIKNGSIFRTSNYGINWSNTNLNAPDVRNIAIHGLYTFACSYGSSGNVLYRSANDGGIWSVLNPASIYYPLTLVSNNTYLYLGRNKYWGSGGGVYRSADNGSTFSYMNSDWNNIPVYVLAAKGSEVYAGTRGSGIYYSGNNCDNWTSASFGLSNRNIYALELSGSNVFAGTDGGVFLSTNRGTNWSAVNSGLTNLSVRSLTASGNNIFAGTKGGIFFSSNNGLNWEEKNLGLNPVDSVTSLILANNFIFAGTGGNSVWRSKFTVPLPEAPVLLSPSNDSIGNKLNIILIWSKPLTAKKYHIVVSTDSLFTNKIVNDSLLTDSLKMLSLSPLTIYYWKVRTQNTTGWSEFSMRYIFKTMGAPSQVNLLFPANNSVNHSVSLIFKWNKFGDQTLSKVKKEKSDKRDKNSDNTEAIANYWFELASDSLFNNLILRDSVLTDTLKSVTGLSNLNKYYWRVKAKNEIGWNDFTSPFNFTTINSPDITGYGVPPNGTDTTNFGATNIFFIANVSLSRFVGIIYFTVSPIEGGLPDGINSISSYFWSVSDSGIIFTDGYFRIPLSFLGGITDPSKLRWLKRSFSGDNWIDIGGIIQDGYLVSTVPFNSFSEFAIGSQDVQPLTSTNIKITVIPEGFYDPPNNRLNCKDSVKVFLRETYVPFAVIDSSVSIIDSLNFTAFLEFKNAPTGSYYLVVRHRNSIETWSKSGGIIFTKYSSMTYDFTSSGTQAYGDNLVQKNGLWCLYSGDINKDGIVDALDRSSAWNDRNQTGYYSSDLNGDGVVDALDRSICWNNRNKTAQIPLLLDNFGKGKGNEKQNTKNGKEVIKGYDVKLDGTSIKKKKNNY
ncbi:MAG: FG-GAP-like repeat-containing protein [Ignavibacteria bacterium]